MSFFSIAITAIVASVKGWFGKEITTLTASAKQEFATVESALTTFVTTDLGKIALDAVNIAQAKLAGASDDAKFEAAKAQFLADAKTSGHDLTGIGKGVVDWIIQSAYTFAAGVTASVAATTNAAAPPKP